MVKNPPANAGEVSLRFDSKVRKSPWKRKQQPTPVFFPGESHGQRSLVESMGLQSWKRLKRLEKETATHSSILSWRIPWTEEPGGVHGVAELEATEATTSSFWLGRIPERLCICWAGR